MSHSLPIAKLRIALVAPVLALLAPLGAQTTWVVPTNAPTVQAAVQAAAPGDVVTMAPGFVDTVANVVIDKAITLKDCRIEVPFVTSFSPSSWPTGILIRNILSGGRVELKNVTLFDQYRNSSLWGRPTKGIEVSLPAGAQGSIVLDAVAYNGGDTRDSGIGLWVYALGGADLIARNCNFVGSSGDSGIISYNEHGTSGGLAASISGASKCIFENCTFIGGVGGDAVWYTQLVMPQSGGAGLVASGAALTNCRVVDAAGGNCYLVTGSSVTGACSLAASPGLSTLAGDFYGSVRQPGRFGVIPGCPPSVTPPPIGCGPPVDLEITPSTCGPGQQFTMRVASLPASQGISGLYMGFRPRRSQLPGAVGPLWIDSISFGTLVPAPDATGWATYVMPAVPSGLPQVMDLVVQSVHLTTSYVVTFGAPRTITATR